MSYCDYLFTLLSRFADGHNCLELASAAIDYINSQFPRVCTEDEFYELPKDQLTRFLASEDLVVDTEFQVCHSFIFPPFSFSQSLKNLLIVLKLFYNCLCFVKVFQAALQWILHDVTQRRQYVFEILTHVRLPLLSTYLLERVINDLTDSSLKVIFV